ncbi:MAG: rod-binding protein [Tateyamaria sp.]|uniref:rod-binding protein n=1 Tax=Tateyamaria sp. TaxID=1929288 RepID=UPI00328D795D
MQLTPMESGQPARPTTNDAAIRDAARKLEASFLAEMLKSAGLGKSRETNGGGAGEDQFSSFLVQAQAEEMVAAGGIGLAETLFDALKERQDAT